MLGSRRSPQLPWPSRELAELFGLATGSSMAMLYFDFWVRSHGRDGPPVQPNGDLYVQRTGRPA
jgi:hypothetical protein